MRKGDRPLRPEDVESNDEMWEPANPALDEDKIGEEVVEETRVVVPSMLVVPSMIVVVSILVVPSMIVVPTMVVVPTTAV
jgi:hypothetical protein